MAEALAMASLRRKAGSALWHQIGETLAAEIAEGSRVPGERLPTEPELMKRFGVSRFTVRQALGSLEARGLLRAEQGRGTFVHRTIEYALSRRTRFSRNLIAQGFEPATELLLHEEIAASELVATQLRISVGAPVIHRRGLGAADGVPIEIGDSFYPAERFPDFEVARRRHATITAALAIYGIDDYERLSTRIEARMPTAEEARLLRQPKSVPVIAVTKIDADQEGRPFIYAETIWSAERVTFTVGDCG